MENWTRILAWVDEQAVAELERAWNELNHGREPATEPERESRRPRPSSDGRGNSEPGQRTSGGEPGEEQQVAPNREPVSKFPVKPQLFGLLRDHGYVAYGVLWANGEVVLHWEGSRPSTVVWRSLADALEVHNVHDETKVVWL